VGGGESGEEEEVVAKCTGSEAVFTYPLFLHQVLMVQMAPVQKHMFSDIFALTQSSISEQLLRDGPHAGHHSLHCFVLQAVSSSQVPLGGGGND
jgi:hypothetical protein